MKQSPSSRSPSKQDYLSGLAGETRDAFGMVQRYLDPKSVSALGRVSTEVRKEVSTVYEIGLNDESYSQFDGEEKRPGWGMVVIVFDGKVIGGENKNLTTNNAYPLNKVYSGWIKDGAVNVKVVFPDIGQETLYEGNIENGIFSGRFTVTKPRGTRQPGSGGVIYGTVRTTTTNDRR